MSDSDYDSDAIFEELESEEISANLREARLAQLKKEAEKIKLQSSQQYGHYTEAANEKEVMQITTQVQKSLVHFYHKDFKRCLIMDRHLRSLSEKYTTVKFIKVDAQNCPFLIERLKVQILPCVIMFSNGYVVDRLTGFDDMGGVDNFETSLLEKRLKKNGFLTIINQNQKIQVVGKQSRVSYKSED